MADVERAKPRMKQTRSCSSRDLALQDMADFQAVTEIQELLSGVLLTTHAAAEVDRPPVVKETNGKCRLCRS